MMVFKIKGGKLHKRTYSMENSARATEESHKSNPAARGGCSGQGGKPEVALA